MTRGACRWAAGGALLVALSGCASTVYEGKYAWDQGWRQAEVVRLGAASELGGRHFSDCRYRAPQGTALAERYAVVSFRYMGRSRRGVVPVLPGASFASGDRVYANVRECSASAGMVRR